MAKQATKLTKGGVSYVSDLSQVHKPFCEKYAKKGISDAQVVKRLLRAIHRNCKECSGGEKGMVEDCPVKKCDLYLYRMGEI